MPFGETADYQSALQEVQFSCRFAALCHTANAVSEFFQTGAIATLHRLGQVNLEQLEEHLENFSLETPMALVLPCHIKEMGTPALDGIISELKKVTYIKQ